MSALIVYLPSRDPFKAVSPAGPFAFTVTVHSQRWLHRHLGHLQVQHKSSRDFILRCPQPLIQSKTPIDASLITLILGWLQPE